MMEQSETEMHMYPTNLRVETQVAGALIPQYYDKHWITLRIQISRCRQTCLLQTVPTIPKQSTALLVLSNAVILPVLTPASIFTAAKRTTQVRVSCRKGNS